MITTFHFIRHGQVENPQDIYYGRQPGYPLSEEGREAIRYRADKLMACKPKVIYYSPMLRSKQSAEILNQILNIPLDQDERLTELNSRFEGRSNRQALQFPVVKSDEHETMADIYSRMTNFITEMKGLHAGSVIIAVSHGSPIRILEMGLENLPLNETTYRQKSVPNFASDTILAFDNNEVEVTYSED